MKKGIIRLIGIWLLAILSINSLFSPSYSEEMDHADTISQDIKSAGIGGAVPFEPGAVQATDVANVEVPLPEIESVTTASSEPAYYAGSVGILYGAYNKVTWTLDLSTGKLNVEGSGSIASIWNDQNGKDCKSSIKTVVISSGITALEDGTFANCVNLKSISMPKTVRSIGANAFYNCKRLIAVSVPTSVTTIGDYAFASCTKLAQVSLPTNLSSLGQYAFGQCPSLRTASIPEGLERIPEGTFYGCKALDNVAFHSNLQGIGNFAFYDCSAITSVNIPCSVGDQAFENCSELTEVTLNGNTGLASFQNCHNLKTLNIGSDVTEIGSGAFNLCTSLKTLSIPCQVTTIRERAFGDCEALSAVQMHAGCTTLEDYAFVNCTALASAVLPAGLTSIGDYCFANCGLNQIALPSSLVSVGDSAFYNCTKLRQASIQGGLDAMGAHCFEGCSALESVEMPAAFTGAMNRLEEATFAYCTSLKSIKLPSNLNSIAGGAFGYCESLTDIDLPDGCTYIGDQAFYGCASLRQIRLPSGITRISNAVFYECGALTEIIIPGSVKGIGEHAFAFCGALREVNLPISLKTIEKYAFAQCTSLNALVIPSAVRIIGDDAFANTALVSLILPSGLQTLGNEAFACCAELEEITIPGQITEVPDGCFFECTGLKRVQISALATRIGRYAFAGCRLLEGLYLPSTLTTIGESAFLNCSSLRDVSLGDAITDLGESAFANCHALKSIYIGAALNAVGDYAFSGCDGLESIRVSPGNALFSSQDDVLYSKDGSSLVFYPPQKVDSRFVVPESVTSLSAGALFNCKNIKTIEFSSGMTEIGARSFYGCSQLESVVIPGNIRSIGEYAFSRCTALEQVTLQSGLEEIEEGAFAGCTALRQLTLPEGITEVPEWMAGLCGSLETVVLPSSVKSIGSSAFFMCGRLEDMSLPNSLEEIGNYAFADCGRLKSIQLPEGVELISGGAFDNCLSIEEVTFNGDVFYIGESAFRSCISLARINFAGNAPEQIGQDAFLDAGRDLKFVYPNGAEGFDSPVWKGPDELEYQTATTYTGKCGDQVQWTLDTYTGVLVVSGTGAMNNYTSAEGMPWYAVKDSIRSVEIQEGVTSVGSMNFMDCSSLETVSLPSSLVETNYAAFANCGWLAKCDATGGLKSVAPCLFYNCYHLTDIQLGNTLEKIGAYAFHNCREMRTLTVPASVKSIDEGAFAFCGALISVSFDGKLNTIGKGAFCDCSALVSVYMNAGMPSSIANTAFAGIEAQVGIIVEGKSQKWTGSDGQTYDTTSLSSLSGACGGGVTWTILPSERKLVIDGAGSMQAYEEDSAPWSRYYLIVETLEVRSGVTGIGDYAFSNLYLLNSVSLPGTLTSIGKYAFANCTRMESCQLPSKLASLGEGVFCDCVSLESIDLPGRLTTVPEYCFYGCEGLDEVGLPSNATTIGCCAFVGCPLNNGIAIPNSVTEIEGYAFLGCYGLTSLALPNSLRSIGESAFLDCVSLESISFNGSLLSIGPYAFVETAVKSVSLPDSVRTVGEYAFVQCEQMTSLDLGKVQSIGDYAFFGTDIGQLRIPGTVTSIGRNTFGSCTSLQAITSESNAYPCVDGVLYAGNLLLQYPAGKRDEVFFIPEFVTSIGDFAFFGNEHLQRVEMGSQVVSLGISCFIFCTSLREAVIGEGISAIPDGAFGDCTQLKALYFRGDAPGSIGDEAFLYIEKCPVFYYYTGRTGWTEGVWVGPDGVSYQTTQFGDAVLIAEDLTTVLSINGLGSTRLKISTPGIDAIEITDVTVDDARFAVRFDTNNRTVRPGVTYEECVVAPISALDATVDYSVTVTVAWATGSTSCEVGFLTAFSYNYALLIQAGGEEDRNVTVTVKADEDAVARECAVVVGVFSDSKMLAAKVASHPVYASHIYRFSFGVEGGTENAVEYRAFLLDANTLVPMSAPASRRCAQPLSAASEGVSLSLTGIEEEVASAGDDSISMNEVLEQVQSSSFSVPRTNASISYANSDEPKMFASAKLTLLKDHDGDPIVQLSYSDQEIAFTVGADVDHVWKGISEKDHTYSSKLNFGTDIVVSFKQSTTNRIKRPPVRASITLDGYLFECKPKKPFGTLRFKNGLSLDFTPEFQVGDFSGEVFVKQSLAGEKPHYGGSGKANVLTLGGAFSLKTADGKELLKVMPKLRAWGASVDYKNVGKKKFRWSNKGYAFMPDVDVEGDFENITNLVKKKLEEKLGEAAKAIEDFFISLEYKDGDTIYELDAWYILQAGQDLQVVPMCVAPIEQSAVDQALPMIAQKAMPTLSDLNLTYNAKAGTIVATPAKQSKKTPAQKMQAIIDEMFKHGNKKQQNAAARMLWSMISGTPVKKEDVNTVNGFLNSGAFSNYTDLNNSLSSGIFRNGDYLDIPSSGAMLKGHVEMNDFHYGG